MSKKQMKSITALVLSLILLFGTVVSVQAAIPDISTSNYIKAYVLSTRNNTPVYTSGSLSKRGTSSPYKRYNAMVYASDEIYIYRMTNSYSYISYPTPSGRCKGYIRTSSITSNNKSVGALTSRARITTYKRAGGTAYGNIDAGDQVYTLAESRSYVQVVYEINGGYKMGWITSSDYNNYIADQPSKTNIIDDGYYQIKSAADTNYVLDIAGASDYEGASALIWQNGNADNTTDMNQKFKIEKASGNYYYIKYAKSNQCLDVYNGEMVNETDIIQWPYHGADNQLWQIEKTTDGYYTIKSKQNGLYMDIYRGDMSNGTNVQCYQWNGAMNQKWILSPARVNGVAINNHSSEKIEQIVNYELSQIGTRDYYGNNNVKYNTWYYGKKTNGSGYAWCQVFQSYCAYECGVLGTAIPKTNNCAKAIKWYQDRKQFYKSEYYGGDYTPKAGDLVFYGSLGSDHVGMIIGDPVNGYLQVVEGNVRNDATGHYEVRKFTRNEKRRLTSSYVYGYASPIY